jgi:hypothetical protein
MSKLVEWSTKHDEECKAKAIGNFRAIADGDMRERARVGAQKVLDDALTAARARAGRIERFRSEATLKGRELRDNLNGLRAEGARAVGNFVLEMDVTDASYLDTYYRAHRIDPTKALTELMTSFKSQAAVKQSDGSEAAFYAWLLGLDGDGIFKAFEGPFRNAYLGGILSTNVVDFVVKQSTTEGAVATKLTELFGMCEPFWKVTEPTSNTTYAHVTALGCTPILSGAAYGFPPEAEAWVKNYVRGDEKTKGIEATNAPYELELVCYTHGARAMYLDDVKDWKDKYDALTKQGAFPLHIDQRFVDLPDLDVTAKDYKDRADGRRAFALGMALGFVAKRGQQYFLNIEAGATKAETGGASYRVPYVTEWQTVFTPVDDYQPPDPATLTLVSFELKKTVPPKKLLLAERRDAACKALEKVPDRTKLILGALSDYVTEVGSAAAKRQLGVYLDFLKSCNVPDDTRKQVDVEAALIASYLEKLE